MCQATFKGPSISLSDYFSAETLFNPGKKTECQPRALNPAKQSCRQDKKTT